MDAKVLQTKFLPILKVRQNGTREVIEVKIFQVLFAYLELSGFENVSLLIAKLVDINPSIIIRAGNCYFLFGDLYFFNLLPNEIENDEAGIVAVIGRKLEVDITRSRIRVKLNHFCNSRICRFYLRYAAQLKSCNKNNYVKNSFQYYKSIEFI